MNKKILGLVMAGLLAVTSLPSVTTSAATVNKNIETQIVSSESSSIKDGYKYVDTHMLYGYPTLENAFVTDLNGHMVAPVTIQSVGEQDDVSIEMLSDVSWIVHKRYKCTYTED